MPIEMSGLPVAEAVKQSFESVFRELNARSDAWWQYGRLQLARDRYAEYIQNTVGRFALFGTNHTATVERAYVLLSFSGELEREKYKSLAEIEKALRQNARRRTTTEQDPLGAVDNSDAHLALVGIAGCGKTTAFRHLALEAARGRPIRGRKRIPLMLAVRDMAATGQTIHAAALSLLTDFHVRDPEPVLTLLQRTGALMLLLDGLDETTSEHCAELVRELERLRAAHPRILICISARPMTLDVALPGFNKWEVMPLEEGERLLFIQKWFEQVDPAKGVQLARVCGGRPRWLELGSRPLFLSIICALYNNDLDIPSADDELYDRAIQGLLGQWDAFRNIARRTALAPFSIRQRLTLVAWLAAALFQHEKRVFSARDVEAIGCLKEAAAFLGTAPVEAGPLLATLYNDFGLLVERAPGVYSFTHLAIHEYLVAYHYVSRRKEPALFEHLGDRDWIEILTLMPKMLPDSSDFLAELHRHSDIGNLASLEILLRVWEARPGCDPAVRADLLEGIGIRLMRVFDQYVDPENPCTMDGKRLTLRLLRWDNWLLEVTQGQFSRYLDILNLTRFDYRRVDHPIINALRTAGSPKLLPTDIALFVPDPP